MGGCLIKRIVKRQRIGEHFPNSQFAGKDQITLGFSVIYDVILWLIENVAKCKMIYLSSFLMLYSRQ